MNKSTIVFLVALRLAIGWHFLFEGLQKIHSHMVGPTETSRPFTSEPYFRESHGPMAAYMRQQMGDPDELLLPKLELRPGDAKPVERIDPSLTTELDEVVKKLTAHYGFNEKQQADAQAALAAVKEKLVKWYSEGTKTVKRTIASGPVDITLTTAQRIEDYKAKLAEYKSLPAKNFAFGKDVEKARASKLKADLAAARKELQDDLDGFQAALVKDIEKLATPEQLQKGPLKSAPVKSPIALVDQMTIWGLTAMGACLLLGLFTRLACLAAAAFLLMTYLTVPAFPWLPTPPQNEGNYLFVNKNVVEMLALCVLATLPTGRWFGLDAFISELLLMIRGAKIEGSEPPPPPRSPIPPPPPNRAAPAPIRPLATGPRRLGN